MELTRPAGNQVTGVRGWSRLALHLAGSPGRVNLIHFFQVVSNPSCRGSASQFAG